MDLQLNKKVNVKYYSKFIRRLYIVLNVFCISLFLVLYIVYSVLKGINGVDSVRPLAILQLSLFICFSVFNFTKIFVELFPRLQTLKTIRALEVKKEYNEAIKHIERFCLKKRAYNTNQILLYNLGYIELLRDNLERGMDYLKEFELERKSNAFCIAYTISLLYLLYTYNRDENSLKSINSVYLDKKVNLIKSTKSVKEVSSIFYAIDCFNDGKIDLGISILKDCRFSNIPFIERFIEESEKK